MSVHGSPRSTLQVKLVNLFIPMLTWIVARRNRKQMKMENSEDLNSIFRLTRGPRGQYYFFYHGYVWVRVRGSPGIVRLRCQQRYCLARATLDIQDRVIEVDPDHVHQHDPPLVLGPLADSGNV
jgi:hypothetical protein